MLYNDILKKTVAARDAIVSAIIERGGTVDSNATLIQCSKAIKSLVTSTTKPAPSGQIFYASFSEDTGVAETGQLLVKINTPQFVVEDGIPCVNLYNSGFRVDYSLFYKNNPFTISYWGKDSSVDSSDASAPTIFSGASGSTYGYADICHIEGGYFAASNRQTWTKNPNTTLDAFYHYVVTYDNKYHLYVDNVLVAETDGTFSLNISSNQNYIGSSNGTKKRNFYLANLKIFTRVLSSEEIAQLYSEFQNR